MASECFFLYFQAWFICMANMIKLERNLCSNCFWVISAPYLKKKIKKINVSICTVNCMHLPVCPTVLAPSLSLLAFGSFYSCVPLSPKQRKKNIEKKNKKTIKSEEEWKERTRLSSWHDGAFSISLTYSVAIISETIWMMNLSLPWSWRGRVVAKLWTIPRKKLPIASVR